MAATPIYKPGKTKANDEGGSEMKRSRPDPTLVDSDGEDIYGPPTPPKTQRQLFPAEIDGRDTSTEAPLDEGKYKEGTWVTPKKTSPPKDEGKGKKKIATNNQYKALNEEEEKNKRK